MLVQSCHYFLLFSFIFRFDRQVDYAVFTVNTSKFRFNFVTNVQDQ
ncbi:Uncharacterised protein [Vibrio cholerae]|nr:Uncharacterised protein [Vibrio cholerae]